MTVKTFPTEKIRNVALVGHGGAGKTSLAEALLFNAGAISRLGRVEDGTTVTDFDPEEAKRRISVSLALAPFEHDGHKVNVIDTPGYADFVSDVAAALRAADLAVFVVSAVEGVEVQTEIVWRMADELGLPRAIFVNKLDRERASFSRTLDELKDEVRCRAWRRCSCRSARKPTSTGSSTCSTTTRCTYVDGTPRHRGPDPARDGDGGARGPRRARRGHRRGRRRPHGALPRRRAHPGRGARARARRRRGVGLGVPRAVRQRDQARRHRPPRAVHHRGRPRARVDGG